jgi:hypothetical protein
MKKLIPLLCLMLPLLASTQANSPPSTRYTVILAGNKAGFATSNRNPDGSLQFYYEFNDRGRGPKVTERVIVDSNGIPSQIDNTGIDYEKAAVDEHFTLKNGTATWKNRAEHGETQVTAKGFYVSLSGAPQEAAVLAQALLSNGGRLALLPAGEASVEKRGELKIEASGQSRTVVQYAITGLDFTPTAIWLNPDDSFFAAVSAWFSVIPEGWESTSDTLLKAQDEIANQRSATLARTLGHKPAASLAFIHANLFDTETATVRPNTTVVITGNRITAVGDDKEIHAPKDAEIIDARGKTLMPGLWDMHVHLGANDGLLHVACGVTSVRDMANDIDQLGAMQRHFDEGSEIGPRVLKAGILDGRGPYQGPTKVFADSEH